MTPPAASIIILTYNNLDLTRQCLESIVARTDRPAYEIIVVDNASSDGTPEYLPEFAASRENCRVILNAENRGFSAGNNQGAATATGRMLVFLNNDVVVTAGWLERLLTHLDDPAVGMAGPVTNSSGNETRISVDYAADLSGLEAFAAAYTAAHAGQAFEIRMLPFQCVALRREVFDEVGPLDERFGQGLFEDDDYALRLRQKGYRILCAEDSFIHHWGSASFSKLAFGDYWKLFKANLEQFEAKWGQKWLPHTPRPEHIPGHLRQLMDASLWLAEGQQQRDAEIASLKAQINELSTYARKLKDHEDELTLAYNHAMASLNYLNEQTSGPRQELENIYQSNSWRLVQRLLRLRRAVIPEGSRREAALRRLSGGRLHGGSRPPAAASAPPGASAAAQPAAPAAAPASVKPAVSTFPGNRFPWPLISVILPVYNHADMLPGAAQSVLQSSYPNLELIILDDGSTDAIDAELARLARNPRVRIYRQPNQKLPTALTHAHALARGEWITWTSADNLYFPTALETLARTLLEHPDTALAYADVQVIDDQGRPLADETYRPQNLDPLQRDRVRLYRSAEPLGYEQDNYVNACFLFRRQPAEALELHYAADLHGLEDYDFWLRLQKTGGLRHAGNAEPLYAYRVHQRSMSHDLLTRQREAHLERGRQFIEFEARRRVYCQQRWGLQPTPQVSGATLLDLQALSAAVPFEMNPPQGWGKLLPILPPDDLPGGDPLALAAEPNHWRLHWRSPHDGQSKTLAVWRGVQVSPLARKARDHQRSAWVLPEAGQRPVVGCHLPLREAGEVDVAAARTLVQRNDWLHFIFIDVPGQDDPAMGRRLVEGLANASYAGARPWGEPYPLYACLAALWLPPRQAGWDETACRRALALAYAIGRPLLLPAGQAQPLDVPYQIVYHPPADSLDFLLSLDRREMDAGLLDRYLDDWTPAAALARALRYADAASLETAVPRPDFRQPPPPETLPVPWTPPGTAQYAAAPPLKAAIAVDTLDRGGLEEVVASLGRGLPGQGVEPSVICWKSGGAAAEALRAEGIPVHVLNSDAAALRRLLESERPDVLNSHWAPLEALQAAAEAGIPVLEAVHNTYVWLDETGWRQEVERSRLFTRLAAVSELVKEYYLRHNPLVRPEWCDVAPNGIDTRRVQRVDQREARLQLGIAPQAELVICLASYDGRKNQMGLLTAFDQVARLRPQARLICAGPVADPQYFKRLKAHRQTLASRELITLDEYRSDTALLLSAADVFVISSFFEGWSLAATEALVAGLPLIHSECGSAWELAGQDGGRGRVTPNPAGDPLALNWTRLNQRIYDPAPESIQGLAAALQAVLTDLPAWQERRARLRTAALTVFGLDGFLRSYRRLLYAAAGRPEPAPARPGSPPAPRILGSGFQAELDYWDRELSLQGDYPQAILDRSQPERMINEYPAYLNERLAELARRFGRTPRVLDAGSGPLSMWAHGAHFGEVELTAADPLADHYHALLKKHGFRLDYPLVQADGEALSRVFGEETFDLVWMHNALDHTSHPEVVLVELCRTLRPGGLMIVMGWAREGTAEGWLGLHQHDISLEPGGKLFCASRVTLPGQPDLFYTRCINAGLPLELVEASEPTRTPRVWISLIWRKLPAGDAPAAG